MNELMYCDIADKLTIGGQYTSIFTLRKINSLERAIPYNGQGRAVLLMVVIQGLQYIQSALGIYSYSLWNHKVILASLR